MAEKHFKEIQCKHCSRSFQWAVPNTSGLYPAICPNCGGVTNVKYVYRNIKLQESAKASPHKVNESVQEPRTLTVTCPDCENVWNFIPPKRNATYKLQCSRCKMAVNVKVEDGIICLIKKIATKPLPIEGNRNNGKLTVLRFTGLFSRLGSRSFPLNLGQNTVGRWDRDIHSDIEIKGDLSMSRRSISIEVIQKENGFFFKLTVLKATCPVMHNNKPLVEGEVIYLNYGDNIKLGQTTFVFNKASSK